MSEETLDQAVEAEPVADAEVQAPETESEVPETQYDDDGNPIEDDADAVELDEWTDDKGRVHKVPKDLTAAALRQADYTRKTQEVAETRKALEAQAQAVAQQAEFVESNRAELAYLGKIDHDYAEWKSWIAENPDQALPADYHKLTTLKEARDQVAASLRQKAHTASVEAQRSDAKALEDMRAELPKTIPGYGPEKEREIFSFATTDLGFAPEEIAGVRSAKIVKALHLAMLGAKTARQTTAAKTVQKQQETAPAPTVAARRAPPSGLDDRLSADEWVRRRQAQLRKSG